MTWFSIALGAPLLWAITNHIDKLLLDKYFMRCGVSTLVIFSSAVGALTLPFLYFFAPNPFAMPFAHVVLLLIVSLCTAASFWLYFKALDEEEASIVVVFYQLIPVFGYIFGYFLLGEALAASQLLAMGLIILGAFIIALEVDSENRFTLKHRTILLMTAASVLSALDSVLFKFVAIQENVWSSLFWEYTGLTIFGLLVFLLVSSCRSQVINTFRTNSSGILAINFLNEFLYILGNFLFSYSYLLAPVALVLLVNSYQPLMVFALGMLLTAFFPHIGTESLKLRHVVQKLLAIGVVGIGTWLLFA